MAFLHLETVARRFVLHLIRHTTLEGFIVKDWVRMLHSKLVCETQAEAVVEGEQSHPYLRDFLLLLNDNQTEYAPKFTHPLVRELRYSSSLFRFKGAEETRTDASGGGGGGNRYGCHVLVREENADVMEYICNFLDASASCAMRAVCRLPSTVLVKLARRCPRLEMAGTDSFPHGVCSKGPFVGLEKELGVVISLAQPCPTDASMGVHAVHAWCIAANDASGVSISGVRKRPMRTQLKRRRLLHASDWYPPPALLYFEVLPMVTLRLHLASTDEVVFDALVETVGSTRGTRLRDGSGLRFTLGARYQIGRDGVDGKCASLNTAGALVAPTYAGVKLASKLIVPPLRGERFVLVATAVGTSVRATDGADDVARLVARSAPFFVRRRSAPGMSQSKRRKFV
jgi:hypothetical protein